MDGAEVDGAEIELPLGLVGIKPKLGGRTGVTVLGGLTRPGGRVPASTDWAAKASRAKPRETWTACLNILDICFLSLLLRFTRTPNLSPTQTDSGEKVSINTLRNP